MKQLLLDLMEENDRRLSILLDQTVEDELMSFMRQSNHRSFQTSRKKR